MGGMGAIFVPASWRGIELEQESERSMKRTCRTHEQPY
jgi:hypothetical protein